MFSPSLITDAIYCLFSLKSHWAFSHTGCKFLYEMRQAPVQIKRQNESGDTEQSANTGPRDYRPSLIRIVWKYVNLIFIQQHLNEEEKK